MTDSSSRPMRRKSYKGLWLHGFHRIDYSEWGDPHNPRVLICVHGLTRNGRDFDALARHLSADYRVFCPDVVGRGTSEWLTQKSDYGYPLYLSDMAALIALTGAQSVDWVGTSMGGIIGMMLAAQPGSPIRTLVLNDVGSIVSAAGLQRLSGYVGQSRTFASLAEVEDYFRRTHQGFGPLTGEQWQHLAVHGAIFGPDGQYRLRYDPAIATAFVGAPLMDIDLSLFWNAVHCRTLVLRGAHSDLLLPQTLSLMQIGHPQLEIQEIPECGHAPALMAQEQISRIREFLL